MTTKQFIVERQGPRRFAVIDTDARGRLGRLTGERASEVGIRPVTFGSAEDFRREVRAVYSTRAEAEAHAEAMN